jgi:predicted nucleic acid-binding protein
MAVAVLVDTSVWVDALRDPGSPCGDALDNLLATGPRVVTTGLVAHEVLQGVATPRQLARLSSLLHGLHRLNPSFATHVRAAGLTRRLRARGITVHTIDGVLAQLALDHRVAIWSLDHHFSQIATATKLRLYAMPVS